jgi:hypothetical protein
MVVRPPVPGHRHARRGADAIVNNILKQRQSAHGVDMVVSLRGEP